MRCKMLLNKIAKTTYGYELDFMAVTSGDAEDTAFWKATPSGTIHLAVVNEGAVKDLEVGEKYYVDFQRVVVTPPK